MDAQFFKSACSCAIRSKCDRRELWTIGDPAMIPVGAIRPGASRGGGIDLSISELRQKRLDVYTFHHGLHPPL